MGENLGAIDREIRAGWDSDQEFEDDPFDFVIEDEDSDFEIESTTKRGKKTAAAKPAAKKAKTTSGTTTKKRAPLKSSANGNASVNGVNGNGTPKASTKKSTASQQYQKLSQLEHVLKRPDTYIGSTEPTEMKMWVYDRESERMVYKDVTIVPGLYKIFDEILVNAADNKIRDPNMDTLNVEIDAENNVISIYNNGRGIPIEIHDKEKMYIPELIFGNLLTSSNYDDDEKKVTGGRNGYGAKLCNIFSTEFNLETADKNQMKSYVQTWTENMSNVSKPKISKLKKADEYTRITFKPDLQKFNMEKLDDDILGVLYRRVYDLAGSVNGIKVSLNKKRLKVKNFKEYVNMFVKALRQQTAEANGEDISDGAMPKETIVHERFGDRWEVAFGVSDGNSFNQVSFVNSIATTSGGTHVNYIADQLVSKISELVKKKNRSAPIRPVQIKNNMFLFINCLIENPAFTSQTKEQLTTKVSAFGSKCILSDDFMKKVLKTSIVENVMDVAQANADKELKKTDGGKKRRLTGFPKLEDANKAGTKEGHKCTLILTEGDSAKALAVAGLAVVGRDYYGVFPLRGKLLNVREASHDQIMKNAEIQAIKQIMGLQHKKHYTTRDGLRYGSIMIMTDQDHDGSHIKGLIINFLETSFPGLLEIPGFLVEFITPIVKVSVMKGKRVDRVIPFYTMPQYELWRDTEGKTCIWKQKYYKGLGTSEPNSEGREYFAQLDKHLKTFHHLQPGDKGFIEPAFAKKNADARKDWLRAFKPGTHLDPDLSEIPISDFINKELILFSMADNIRSIPNMLDGFKPGQRKILYGCFKRNLTTDIKVAQLGGYISENTGYHHGEQSLYQTIVGLAQDFVGANNLYFLMPRGSFGSRAVGGKDASAPRYIFTELNKLTRKVFNPNDDPLLKYLDDDESTVEPEWYLPVLPTLLVNGAEGIGTGWSTNIPPFNPMDLVDNIRRLMNGEDMETMTPWFRGWDGTIERIANDKFRVNGVIEQIDDRTVEITELPARMWTQTMKEFLLDAIVKDKRDKNDKGWIEDMTEEHGVGVKFVVTMNKTQMENALKEGLLQKFKLTATINLGNMIAFDPQCKIKKYDTPEQILSEFYYVRLEYYQKRKDYIAGKLKNQLEKLSHQARFVKLIIDKKLSVSNRRKDELIDELHRLKFPKYDKNGNAVWEENEEDLEADRTVNELEEMAEQDEEAAKIAQDETVNKPQAATYDYLLGMSLWSLTRERYEKLIKERDNKESELNELLKKSAKDLWNFDLDEFVTHWEEFLEEDREKREAVVLGAKRPAKKRGGGRKKKNTGDDDDEDFVVGSKKKPAASRVKKEPAKAVSSKAASSIAGKKQTTLSFDAKPEPPKKKSIFGNTSSIFGTPPSKKRDEFDMDPDDLYNDLNAGFGVTSSAKKPSVKKNFMDEFKISDDEEDPFSEILPSKKRAPAAKAKAPAATKASSSRASSSKPVESKAGAKPKAKKKGIFDSDEEMEDKNDMDEVEEIPAPRQRARRGAATKKSYVIDDSSMALDSQDDDFVVDDDEDDFE